MSKYLSATAVFERGHATLYLISTLDQHLAALRWLSLLHMFDITLHQEQPTA